MATVSVGSAVPCSWKVLSTAAAIFTLASFCPASFASEAPVYGVYYGTQYEYWNGSLSPWTIGASAFEAWVRARPVGEVTTTRLSSPIGSQQNMADEPAGAYLIIAFPQESYRNMLFPPGNYTFTERLTTGANRTHTLSLSASAGPAAATFVDTTGWDAWPARKPLRVAWQPGGGTLTSDVFVLAVHDMTGIQKMFESPGPGEANALTAATNSFTIPGECLTNSGSFLVRIACYRSSGAAPTFTGAFVSTFARFTIVAETAKPVSYHHLLTGRLFEQTGEAAPVLLASNPYAADACLRERTAGQVQQAQLHPPSQPAITLSHVDGETDWNATSMYASSAELSAAWSAGNYKWTIEQILGGTQEAVQSVGQPGTSVPPLQILNLSQLRTNTFDEDTLLQWTPTGPVSAEDHIEFIVRDKTGEELLRLPPTWLPEWMPPQIIKGDATSLIIEANDLPANKELLATLRYIHTVQRTTNTFGDAEAISGHFAETRFRIGQATVAPPLPLSILAIPLELGTAGNYYTAQLAASGGTRPFVWSATGNLPPGLSLSTHGALQGTPTLAGDYAFTVLVRDVSNQVAQAALTMAVTGAVRPLYIATTNLPAAQGSWPYLTELSSGGGLEPVKWELVSGQLPRGITLLKDKGIITGTPAEGGNFNCTVRLTDAAGSTRQRSLSLIVSAPEQSPLTISKCEMATPGILALELNAEPGEPVSLEHSTDCVTWTTLLATDYPTMGHFEVAPSGGPSGFYRARWGRAQLPANPPGPVKPELDTNLVVSATFEGTNDLTLTLTNTLGHIYRLQIPSNALPHSVDIKMQFVRNLGDSPFPSGYHGGVELRPGGLTFRQPATLTVTFPQGVPPNYTPLAWDSGGWNPHMCIARSYSNEVVIPIMHFSGFGGSDASSGDAANQTTQNPACPKYAGEELVAAAMKASSAKYEGQTFDPQDLIPAFKQWFDTSVWPGLKTAESDYSSLDYAIREFQTWHRGFQLVGLRDLAEEYSNLPPGSGTAEQRILLSLQEMIATKVPKSMARGYANAIVQTHIRAVSEQDAWIAQQMLDYSRAAALLGVTELLPNYLSLEAVAERLSRVWRFEMLIDSAVDVDSGEGYFVEQVRSDRCPIEMDPNTTEGVLANLLKGFTTNVNMVSWEFQRGDAAGRTRPIPEKGELKTYFLKIDPVYAEQTGGSAPEPKCTPDAPKFPSDAKITLIFYHTDPVKQMEAKDQDGVWHRTPVGQSWELVMKTAHSMIEEEYRFFKQVQWPQPATDVYLAGPKVWTYSGGAIFADITHTRDFPSADGLIKERTSVELYYAPKPLRDSDTKLPPAEP